MRRRAGLVLHNEQGSIAILFAVCLMVLAGITGAALDYYSSYRVKTEIQNAADSAALAAATAASKFISKNGYSFYTLAAARDLASKTAQNFFLENKKDLSNYAVSPSVQAAVVGREVDVKVNYALQYTTLFGSLFGYQQFSIRGTSRAAAQLPPFVDVYLLIDTSGSMALGAGQAEQDALRAQFGCAFACHDGNPVAGYADTFEYAVANNITLRHTAINRGILSLLNYIDQTDSNHTFVQIAVHSFDNVLHTNSPLTSDTSAVRSMLPSAPATSNETQGATHFNENISEFIAKVGTGGDGNSRDTAMKLVIIATDGAQDPGRTWTTIVAQRDLVGPFDMSFCSDLKSSGVKIGIIHTPYLQMDYDWGYNATLGQPSQIGGPGTRADDIPIGLKACAGPRYVEANDAEEIVKSFSDVFSTVMSVRLTD